MADRLVPNAGFFAALLALAFALLLAPAGPAEGANPTACTGGNFDPPNNGGASNFNCTVSGNSGSITNVALQSVVSHGFPPCVNEHTFRLFSPLGTEHLIGTRNGNQTIATIATFNGQSANGTWTLRENDSNGNDFCNSNVASWQLTFTLSGGTSNPSVVFLDSALNENGAPSLRVQVDTEDGQPTQVAGSVDILLDSENPGSAELGSDFTQAVTTLAVPLGTADGTTFDVLDLIDDALLERPETIGVMFDDPTNLNASGSRFQVTISDDETGVVVFSPAASTTAEFGSPLHALPMQVEISSGDGTPGLGLFLFGTIARISGTATQGSFNVACPNQDWSFFNDPVTSNNSDEFFLNSGTPTYSPRLRICDDGAGDAGETVVLRASLNSPPANVSVGPDHTVTISELAGVAVGDASAPENGGVLQFTVSLSAPAPVGGVEIDWQTAAGGASPATAGTDYTAASGSVTIPQAASQAFVNVTLAPDSEVESDETLLLQLTGVDGAGFEISDDEAVGTIQNDDTEFRVFLIDPDVSSAFEGSGGDTRPFTLRVYREGLRTSAQSVQIHTEPGTATGGGVDFLDLGVTTLNFAIGQTFADVIVQIVSDDLDENDESFTAPLANATGGATVSPTQGTATVTILDDDNPTLSIGDALVDEDAGQAVFDVTLSGATVFPVSVSYGSGDNGATSPADYHAVSGTLDFSGSAGEVRSISVPIVDDDLQESDEGFRVFLHSPVNATVIDMLGDGTIVDNDIPALSITDASVDEDGNVLAFVVSTGVRVQNAVTVFYDTADGPGPDAAVAPGDYGAIVNGSIVVAQGSSQGTINILVQDDSDIESDETMTVTLSGSSPTLAIDDATASGTIVDDDRSRITVEDAVAVEDSGTLLFTLSASRSAPPGGIDIDYTTAIGGPQPATADDFVAAAGTVTLPSGADSTTVAVAIVTDGTVEPDETLLLQLTGIGGMASIEDAEGVGEIVDDDSASVSIDDVVQAEGDSGSTAFVFSATLTGAVQDGFSLPFTTTDDSAAAGSDYAASAGSLDFLGGNAEVQSLSVAVSGDGTVESDERFFLDLGAPSKPGITLDAARAEAVIVNDDIAPIGIFIDGFEGDP